MTRYIPTYAGRPIVIEGWGGLTLRKPWKGDIGDGGSVIITNGDPGSAGILPIGGDGD